MRLINKKVLNVNITINSEREILEYVKKYLKNGQKFIGKNRQNGIQPLCIFTPNPEIIVYAQKNREFKRIVNTAQINFPDGSGVVWALKKLYNLHIYRLTGTDFMAKLCELAAKIGVRVGLIGGRKGVAVEASECLHRSYNKLKIGVLGEPEVELRITNYELRIRNKSIDEKRTNIGNKNHNALFRVHDSINRGVKNSEEYFQSLLKKIIMQEIDILFVGLGFPKQEFFIKSVERLASSVELKRPLVLMAVGGAFDYISGRIPRAPEWVRNMGLEWLYRLVREPWRTKRQIFGTEFFWKIINS